MRHNIAMLVVAGVLAIGTSAAIAAPVLIPNLAGNSAIADANLEAQADLEVGKTGPPNGAPGSNVTFTLTATNNGPQDANNVVMFDSLLSGVYFISLTQDTGPAATMATPSPGDTGIVRATWATLGSGQTATFTLVLHIRSGFAGPVLNNATIASDTPDPVLANDNSSASVAVTTSTTLPTTAPSTTTPASPAAAGGDEFVAVGAEIGPGGATFGATGFAPGEVVTVTLYSTPRPLATLTADANGLARITFAILASDGAGEHSVVFTGRSGTVSIPFTLVIPAQEIPPTL